MIDRRRTLGLLSAGAMAAAAPGWSRARGISEVFETYDALGIARLVRRREVSPAELLAEALRRTDSTTDTVHAVVLRHDAAAQAQLRASPAEGPFAGVPFLLKDLGVGLAGTATTAGSRFFRDAIAAEDSEVVRRYKQAGLVIFGKTHSPELGLTGTAESALYGATRNPWDLGRIVGGSSGGAGAAVAARIVPIAHASDGAGSIRTPASCCGVFGLKPSRGRVPLGPQRIEGWNGLSTQHAVSMTVRDSAALLDATAGAEPGAPYRAPPPERPYLEEVGRDPGRLRIALVRAPTSGSAVDPTVLDALVQTGRLLEGLGHRIEEARFPVEHAELNQAMLDTLCVSTLKSLEERAVALGRACTPQDVETVTWMLAEMGRKVSGLAYADARAAFDRAGQALARFHERFDVVLCPTVAKPPLPLGVIGLSPVDFDVYVREVTTFGPFTALNNMTGQPAMSVPLQATPEGLPLGMMFAAAYGGEALLYRLAGQLEQARPWRMRRAPHAAPV